MKKNKKIIISIIIISLFLSIVFFIKNYYKNIIIGNNISSKSTQEIVDNILNMKSYDSNITVKIISNKNENTYVINQTNISNRLYKQEILEPENIKGTVITYENGKLNVKNTRLNLNKIYEDYKYITNNQLLLNSFIEDYKNKKGIIRKEDQNNIELTVKTNINKYIVSKILIIDKNTGKPKELQIKDDSQNTLVYILYNRIEVNGIKDDKVLS